MAGDTNELLKNYHNASRRLERSQAWQLGQSEEWIKEQRRLCAGTRELISRMIMSDDPRSLMHLIGELEILLRILGQPFMAGFLHVINDYLTSRFEKNGSFGLTGG